MNRRAGPSLAGVIFACSLAGCSPVVVFRAETRVHPDGKVERAIYQDAERTPVEAQDPKKWARVTFAPDPKTLESRGWPAQLTELPVRAKDKRNTYFVAWQGFKAPRDIPDHVVYKAPEGVKVPDGKLARDYTRNDYAFVVEHRWQEKLTDCVTFDGMRVARRELMDLLIDMAATVFNEELGQEYDVSGLVEWLRTEGEAWLAEVTDALFVRAVQGGDVTDRDSQEEVARICARHGLDLRGQDGRPMSEEVAERRVEEFVIALVLKRVRFRDGRPLDRKAVGILVGEIQASDRPVKEGELKQWEAMFARKYGGEKALEARVGTPLFQIFGLYLPRTVVPFVPPDKFDYKLTMPGEVVEANGKILSADRVLWRFVPSEAYPLGYVMKCRSLATDPAMLKLLVGQPLADREHLLKFVDIVEGQGPLIEVLQECRRKEDLAPLLEFRKVVAEQPNVLNNPDALYDLYQLLNIKN